MRPRPAWEPGFQSQDAIGTHGALGRPRGICQDAFCRLCYSAARWLGAPACVPAFDHRWHPSYKILGNELPVSVPRACGVTGLGWAQPAPAGDPETGSCDAVPSHHRAGGKPGPPCQSHSRFQDGLRRAAWMLAESLIGASSPLRSGHVQGLGNRGTETLLSVSCSLARGAQIVGGRSWISSLWAFRPFVLPASP